MTLEIMYTSLIYVLYQRELHYVEFLIITSTVFDTIIFTRLHVFAGINFKRDNKKVFTGGKHISSSNLFESFAALHCRGEKPEKTFKKFNAEHAIYC